MRCSNCLQEVGCVPNLGKVPQAIKQPTRTTVDAIWRRSGRFALAHDDEKDNDYSE
jgi:hypothetical protein